MTGLPLLESDLLWLPARNGPNALVQIGRPPDLIPRRAPQAGEQYRFHFDMRKCIGCKCCVVACNEQNGNPAAITWRRVGEIEGGHYPNTQRHYLSMGCNQCIEPSCLIGCPTEAYTKNAITGVVEHSADACIGCQYCTWNCSYGVPQYNAERGVVGKCDLCHNRLSDGMAPACVEACPEGAIAIEIVNVAQWRLDYLSANAPGLPSADDSISTTRITLPENLSPDTGRVDTGCIRPGDPHLPLIFMLVLTQLAVGAFGVLWLLDLTGQADRLWISAMASLALAAVSLSASILHLGRPVYAWRAMRGLRRSWLSREVLGLSLFALIATVFAVMLLMNAGGRPWIGLATVACGAAGVICSARIYVVRARPAWYSGYTVMEFFATALLLGPLFVRAMFVSEVPWAAWMAAAGGAAQLVTQTLKFLWLSQSETFELRGSSLLLSRRFRTWFLIRLGSLVAAGIVAPLALEGRTAVIGAFALALAGEWLGRWLFFVTVVPKDMGAAFSAARRVVR
jgi:Fe-S-cluster-containing dehydrogenase component/DMSO reductase anchor subunit